LARKRSSIALVAVLVVVVVVVDRPSLLELRVVLVVLAELVELEVVLAELVVPVLLVSLVDVVLLANGPWQSYPGTRAISLAQDSVEFGPRISSSAFVYRPRVSESRSEY
jgi:hypothetical protein